MRLGTDDYKKACASQKYMNEANLAIARSAKATKAQATTLSQANTMVPPKGSCQAPEVLEVTSPPGLGEVETFSA